MINPSVLLHDYYYYYEYYYGLLFITARYACAVCIFRASKRQCSTNNIGIVRFKLKLWINFNRPAVKKIGRTYALQVGSLGSQAQCSMLFLFLSTSFFPNLLVYVYVSAGNWQNLLNRGSKKKSQRERESEKNWDYFYLNCYINVIVRIFAVTWTVNWCLALNLDCCFLSFHLIFCRVHSFLFRHFFYFGSCSRFIDGYECGLYAHRFFHSLLFQYKYNIFSLSLSTRNSILFESIYVPKCVVL